MRQNSSERCFAVIKAVFPDQYKAKLAYSSMKPDEAFNVKGLRAATQLMGCEIIFKVECERGIPSLAYTLFEYLQHLKMIEEAILKIEGAKYP